MRRRTDVPDALRERIVSAVHFGRLAAGDQLPSARQLAGELRADPRVVAAAYDVLVREGLVNRREGSRGYFVAVERATGGALPPTVEWLVETLAEGIARGVPVTRFVEHARRSLESARVRAACVECNDDQLGWLCGELADDYGFASRPVDCASLGTPAARRALAAADVIVTTAPHAAHVRPLARQLGRPLVLVTLRPDVVDDVAARLADGPVYYLCTDPRFAAKLRTLFRGIAGGRNVRPVVLGRDEPESIPAGAPTWVMRTAAERLGGPPAHVLVLPTARVFSADTRRELLTHVVRANLDAADRGPSATRAKRG